MARRSIRLWQVRRCVLGKPGSFRWWLTLSIVWIIIAGVVWGLSNQVIAVFAVVAVAILFSLCVGHYEGDEDKMRAGIGSVFKEPPADDVGAASHGWHPPEPWPDAVPDDFEPCEEPQD